MKDDNKLDLGVEKYGFQHAIGDCVRLRVGGVTKDDFGRSRNSRWMVNGQELEICSGGTQRKYTCRGSVPGGTTISNPVLFHEHELEACEPFPCEEETKKSDG